MYQALLTTKHKLVAFKQMANLTINILTSRSGVNPVTLKNPSRPCSTLHLILDPSAPRPPLRLIAHPLQTHNKTPIRTSAPQIHIKTHHRTHAPHSRARYKLAIELIVALIADPHFLLDAKLWDNGLTRGALVAEDVSA